METPGIRNKRSDGRLPAKKAVNRAVAADERDCNKQRDRDKQRSGSQECEREKQGSGSQHAGDSQAYSV